MNATGQPARSKPTDGDNTGWRARFEQPPMILPAPVLFGLTAWAIATASGYLWLLSYSATPGTMRTLEPTWPKESRVIPDSARANLVMLIHPHCPCSRASMAELREIMMRCEGLVTAHVLFLKPSRMPAGWEVTDLWHLAVSIPGVRVLSDPDGAEARRFGAATSGQVMLYDQPGCLKFHGGITIARGHRGESVGRQAVVDWLTHGTAERSSAAVFGCSLNSSGPAAAPLLGVVSAVMTVRSVTGEVTP